MDENEISEKIIGCAIKVHKNLGLGLLESIYEEALCYELQRAGLRFRRQLRVPIKYESVTLATPLRLDLLVEEKVIVDNKAVAEITPIDKQQLLTYSRLLDKRLGLLINYNVIKLVDGIRRVVNDLPE
jgi:GxxExxY protein